MSTSQLTNHGVNPPDIRVAVSTRTSAANEVLTDRRVFSRQDLESLSIGPDTKDITVYLGSKGYSVEAGEVEAIQEAGHTIQEFIEANVREGQWQNMSPEDFIHMKRDKRIAVSEMVSVMTLGLVKLRDEEVLRDPLSAPFMSQRKIVPDYFSEVLSQQSSGAQRITDVLSSATSKSSKVLRIYNDSVRSPESQVTPEEVSEVAKAFYTTKSKEPSDEITPEKSTIQNFGKKIKEGILDSSMSGEDSVIILNMLSDLTWFLALEHRNSTRDPQAWVRVL